MSGNRAIHVVFTSPDEVRVGRTETPFIRNKTDRRYPFFTLPRPGRASRCGWRRQKQQRRRRQR